MVVPYVRGLQEDDHYETSYLKVRIGAIASFVPYLVGSFFGAPFTLQISASCKHYAYYSLVLQDVLQKSSKKQTTGKEGHDSFCHILVQEEADGMERYGFAPQVSFVDSKESYLPPFEACVKEGKATGVMCSYTARKRQISLL